MLVAFGAKNFCCFNEWLDVDLSISLKKTKEISNHNGITNLLCLKGGNASGKTSAMKVLSFIAEFSKDSFNYKPEEEIKYDTFFNNSEPSEFFIEFIVNNIEYEYLIELTKKKVLSEAIYRKDKRRTLIFKRTNNKIEKNSLFVFKNDIILRDNASFISTAYQYEIKEIKEIYLFFSKIITNVSYIGLTHDFFDPALLSDFYNRNKDLLSFTINKIKQFDTGIVDIKIEFFENEKKEKIYFPVFYHKKGDSVNQLNYLSQSSGTKALFLYLVLYYLVLQTGGVLALDEFDISLHPDILPHLVELFNNNTENQNNAQLIFSTHNSDVLDIMGKYRTYLFNKENGASYCYRLDEINDNLIRNDRSILSLYKSGKIGGVPKI
jgi:uncharacterized protein